MSRRLDRMRANPRGDWTIADVEAVCREYGIECRPSPFRQFSLSGQTPGDSRDSHCPLQTANQIGIYSQVSGYGRAGQESVVSELRYPVLIEPLSDEDGGGFLATVPDLPGCMSDGETPEEALVNIRDAILTWIEAAEELGRPVPEPSRTAA